MASSQRQKQPCCEICGSATDLTTALITDTSKHSISPTDTLPSGSPSVICEKHYHSLSEERQDYHVREIPPETTDNDSPLIRKITISQSNIVISSERSLKAWIQYNPTKAVDREANR